MYLAKISGERLQDHWSSGYICQKQAPGQLSYIPDSSVCDYI